MKFRDIFGDFKFGAFSTKNVLVAVAVIISLSLIESSMYFFSVKIIYLRVLLSYLKYAASLL